MPYSPSIDGRIVHVRWSGALSRRDIDAFGAEIPRMGRELGFAPDVLHTFAEVTSGLRPAEAFLYSMRAGQQPIPNPIRAAIVANTEECEALATVFKTLNATPNLEMRIFPDETAARHWLARR